jgi:hypothetical protein
MKTENNIEDKIDAIRDSIYEDIKDMSPAEANAYFQRATERAVKEYGIRRVASAQANTVILNKIDGI